jgi:general secretion pathway protein D
LNAILNEPGTTATLQRASKGLSEYDAESGSSGAGQEENSAGTITPWWNRQIRTADTEMPTSNLIGKVRFIPVHRSKAILVLAPREYMEDVEDMIAELDKPGMQVMIKVHIVEIDHKRMTSLGVQLANNPSIFGTLGEDALFALADLTRTENYGRTVAKYNLNVAALVDLLVKNADARVLNQPTLWTKDNKEAVFIKGKEIAFLDNSQTDATGSVTQTFNYRDVGVTLRVRPNITPEKAVDMTINLTISEAGEEINTQVSINKLDATTNIIVNNGQTILLGGILFRNDSTIQRKVPLLGDIPIVGEAFKHTESQARNNELLSFVTPYVVDAENMEKIPADADTMEQIEEPRRRMEDIISQLDDAIERAIKQDTSPGDGL